MKEESFIVPVLTGKINSSLRFWWEAATQALMSFDHTYSWGYEWKERPTCQRAQCRHVVTCVMWLAATPKTSAEPHSCLMKCIVEFLPDPVFSEIINWKDANEFIWRAIICWLRKLQSQNIWTPVRWWWTVDALQCLHFYMNSSTTGSSRPQSSPIEWEFTHISSGLDKSPWGMNGNVRQTKVLNLN